MVEPKKNDKVEIEGANLAFVEKKTKQNPRSKAQVSCGVF
jgi:hypothetical protein